MIQDLTKDEMLWRYENLMKLITDEIDDNSIEKQPEDKDVDFIDELISGALVYLQKVGAINIVLHNDENVDGAVFTANREECVNTSWIEPDEVELQYGNRPNNKKYLFLFFLTRRAMRIILIYLLYSISQIQN